MRKEYKKKSPIERLNKHKSIDEETECWNWNGPLDKNGYGKITINKKTMQVHRYAYAEYKNVELTRFDILCHQCHNRKCLIRTI